MRSVALILAAICVSSQATASEYGDCKSEALISAGTALAARSLPAYISAIDKQAECKKLISKLPPDEQKKVIDFNDNIDREQRRNLWIHGNL